MFDEPVVYVDIETTGIGHRTSRIIEIAIIRVESGEITESFTSLVHPGSPIPYHITRITNITDHDVSSAPSFEQIAEQVHAILSGAIFIAHNVRFDYSFIKHELGLCNINFNPRMLCSVRMSRALYPNERGHSLQAIINRFDITTKARHRAHDDAVAIIDFFKIAHQQHGQAAFDAAVQKQLKHRSAPPNVSNGAFDRLPNRPGVYTFTDSTGTPIYIGKSVTIRKRVMSHFSQDTAIDKEMKLSLNTHAISYVETANELEALLLESQMIKEKLPVYNRRLRRLKKMYIVRAVTDSNGYRVINLDFIDSEDLTPDHSIYGVYASKMKAKSALENLQKTYDLCPKLLGLEKTKGGCFRSQLGKCKGACLGLEEPSDYNQRFETAFERHRIDEWPYKNPIVVSHPGEQKDKHLVIDNWNVIGELQTDEGCEPHYKPWASVFDIDTYKIIRSYLAHKSALLQLKPITYIELDALS